MTPPDPDDLDVELGEAWYEGSREAEDRHVAAIFDVIHRAVEKRFREGHRPARRDAHAFDTGCVRAVFRVDDDLDPALRHGVFAELGREFPAWIRFSNSNFYPIRPRSPDARGMAIKLTGVPGPKLVGDPSDSQDFILVSHPVFFIDDLKRYRDADEAYLAGGFWRQWIVAPAKMRSASSALIGARVNVRLMINPLFIRYWSMTAYRLGTAAHEKIAVKYAVIPCPRTTPPFHRRLTSYLRSGYSPKQAVADSLAATGVAFDFYLQRYIDRDRTPVETAMVEWKERIAPLEHVARITVPPQPVRSPERDDFCERLSFNPWHCLAEHKPLGVVNRARRRIYESASRLRHDLNKV
jgi:hypothetical protein